MTFAAQVSQSHWDRKPTPGRCPVCLRDLGTGTYETSPGLGGGGAGSSKSPAGGRGNGLHLHQELPGLVPEQWAEVTATPEAFPVVSPKVTMLL